MSEEQAEQELFDHLVAGFGDRGEDAVQFLRTARRLVAEDPPGSSRGRPVQPPTAFARPSNVCYRRVRPASLARALGRGAGGVPAVEGRSRASRG
jgi:hypothetical protein